MGSPVTDHLALLDRQPHKLKSATKPVLITNLGTRADGETYIREPQFDRDRLTCGQLPGYDRTDAGFAQVGTASGHIVGDSRAQGDHVQGHVDGVPEETTA
jgi:hypothetical protein